jgi:hypothetical protein
VTPSVLPLLAALAQAADLPDLPRREEVPAQKPVSWVFLAFEDPPESPDCAPEAALRGACVERVRFAELSAEDRARSTQAGRVSLSRLQERLWVDLAYRWARDGDLVATTLQANGAETLPGPAATWDRWKGQRGVDSLADTAAWLPEPRWLGMPDEGDPAFPLLRYRVSQGQHLPPLSLLAGRFAIRLGADGEPFNYELMDADPTDSRPFNEQLYPYQSHAASGALHPLAAFDLPSGDPDHPGPLSVPALVLPEDSYEALSRAGELRFRQFATRLSVQIAQYAIQDYTLNHMRVMGALTGMIYPPGWGAAGLHRGRGIVAAALGETDLISEQASRIEGPAFTLQGGFHLNTAAIPLPVVEEWVTERLSTHPFGGRAREELVQDLLNELRPLLRDEATPPASLDSLSLRSWTATEARPGSDLDLLFDRSERLVLDRQLLEATATGKDAIAQAETDLLLLQVWSAAARAFDATEGLLSPPGTIAASVTGQWASVLGRHGVTPQPMPQGLGAIDPLSICTTKDGVAALEEPSVGAVSLDLVFVAPDKPELSAAEALWYARSQLPFVAIDRPSYNPPAITRLVALPGGEDALYRVRWRIWTGWHMLWTTEPTPDGPPRLALRTGAICDDTLLAPPGIVPTLLRASLLDGTLRGTEAVPLFGAPKEPTAGPEAAEVTWLRERLLAPLEQRATKDGGLLVVVGDLAPGERGRGVTWLFPRSPYARARRGLGEGATRAALWARSFSPEAPPDQSVVVFPGWRPGESVDTRSAHPRWFRNTTANVGFTSGLGVFPYRDAEYACNEAIVASSYVADCSVDPAPDHTRTEGLSLDIAALTTWWFFDHPRLGLDGGLVVNLEASHAGPPYSEEGPSWIDESPDFTFLYRPAGGLMAGLRLAPRAWPLHTPRGSILWGAEQQDGSSRLRRPELGLRGAFLVGPGFNGAEGTASLELWLALSARSNRSRYANITPYNPRQTYGIFIRPSFTFPFADTADRTERYVLERSRQLLIGVRGSWDIQGKLPEAPKPE